MHCRLAVLVVALASALAGCEEESVECNCAPCPAPAVSIVVTDATTGGTVAAVTATGGGAEWTCTDSGGTAHCFPGSGFLGETPFALTVAAPGYQPGTTLVENVTPVSPVSPRISCCGPCPTFAADPVALLPL